MKKIIIKENQKDKLFDDIKKRDDLNDELGYELDSNSDIEDDGSEDVEGNDLDLDTDADEGHL